MFPKVVVAVLLQQGADRNPQRNHNRPANRGKHANHQDGNSFRELLLGPTRPGNLIDIMIAGHTHLGCELMSHIPVHRRVEMVPNW